MIGEEIFRSKISKEEVVELPLIAFDGEIIVIETAKQLKDVLPEIKKHEILGFDTETRPTFKKGRKNAVALLQLSSAEQAFLVRMNLMGLPPQLGEILANEDVIKTGVAINDDLKVLQNRLKFKPAGFIELQKYTTAFGIEENSLRHIAAIVLGGRISKTYQVSNWESPRLSVGQIKYAATDAWIGHEVYTKLREKVAAIV